ncbi:tetratricopeptide repeat protein [bacterium]|nr:tetratricopeptide repeat protein [bacterium]
MRVKLYILILILIIFSLSCTKNYVKLENNYAIDMMKKGIFKEAEFHFRNLVKENPKDWIAHNNLGVCLEAEGKYDEALLEYETALSIISDNKGIDENYKGILNEMAN